MERFETVVIQRVAGHYRVVQGDTALLSVPRAVFDRYEPDSVFPPLWRAVDSSHPVRRLYWNPHTSEFLMAGLEAHPARTAESFGSTAYRSFVQGFWIPTPPVLLFRPYWNPADPYEPFDQTARKKSFEVQQSLLEILIKLRPPAGWSAILNATDPYLEVLGLNPHGIPPEPEAIRELSLTPPRDLTDDGVREALEVLAVEHAGGLCPVIRQGTLAGVHALCLPAMLTAEALLDRFGLAHQEGPFRPH